MIVKLSSAKKLRVTYSHLRDLYQGDKQLFSIGGLETVRSACRIIDSFLIKYSIHEIPLLVFSTEFACCDDSKMGLFGKSNIVLKHF